MSLIQVILISYLELAIMRQEQIYDPKHPYIPLSMFLFFPTEKEDLHSGEGKMFKRFIFEGDELQKITDFEKQQLEKLQLYIKEREHKLPTDALYDPFWTTSWKLRWLVSLRFETKRVVKEMIMFSEYMKTNRFDVTQRAQNNLKQGVIYLSGRDSSYRPIVVFNIAKVIDLSLTGQPLFQALKFFVQFVIENVLLPGQAETINIIIDCGYRNVFSMLSAVRETINFLQSRFRSRLKAAYLNKIPPTAQFLWGIIKNFLQEDTLKRIFLIKGNNVGPLMLRTNPSQIEEKYGGTQQNITQYWPIQPLSQLNFQQYHCDEHYPKLITLQQYQQRYRKGQLKGYTVCEKLLEEDLKGKFQEHITEAPVADSTNKEEIFDPSVVFPAEKYPLQPTDFNLQTFDWFSFKEHLLDLN